MENIDLSMDSAAITNIDPRRITSFTELSGVENKPSKVTANIELAFKLDCYSFAIVLWVLLGWEIPFRNITPMQILIAVGYQNKRPSTKKIIAAGWPEPVVDLMRRLWSTSPRDRPNMTESRELLSRYSS